MYHKKIATFVKLTVGNVPSVFLKESFNNYYVKGEGVRKVVIESMTCQLPSS
jgi:hypothetical protein